jgi:hypothetical protein
MTPIYHITHVANLPSIIADGGLWCDRLRATRAAGAVSIAHQHIKERRSKRRVPVAAGGTLADYVPFYFAPCSPMLFTISRGNVQGYTEGQRPIVHLVSTVETTVALNTPWTFTDGHAEMMISQFFTDLGQLSEAIDWKVMRSQYWNDTREDNDRKRRRQAEFLVHEFFPWSAIRRIGVRDNTIQRRVDLALSSVDLRPEVVVEPDWYY